VSYKGQSYPRSFSVIFSNLRVGFERPRVNCEIKLKPTGEVTAGTAARILGLSFVEINRLCQEGTLRARQIGERGWWRIEYASVIDFLNAEKQQ
jgi:Helix-turn-helix domain